MKLCHHRVLNILRKGVAGGPMRKYAISQGLAVWRGTSTLRIAHHLRLVVFGIVGPPLRLFVHMKKTCVQNFSFKRTEIGGE